MKAWEYMVVAARDTQRWPDESILNEYGGHGWEAVGVIPNVRYASTDIAILMKREKGEAHERR